MILPHPESDMKLNIMVLGSELIAVLKNKNKDDKYVLIENLMTDFLKKDERRTPDLFMNSLVFLYSVGIINLKGYKIKLSRQLSPQIKLFD